MRNQTTNKNLLLEFVILMIPMVSQITKNMLFVIMTVPQSCAVTKHVLAVLLL